MITDDQEHRRRVAEVVEEHPLGEVFVPNRRNGLHRVVQAHGVAQIQVEIRVVGEHVLHRDAPQLIAVERGDSLMRIGRDGERELAGVRALGDKRMLVALREGPARG